MLNLGEVTGRLEDALVLVSITTSFGFFAWETLFASRGF
jgi:hypothetical protein